MSIPIPIGLRVPVSVALFALILALTGCSSVDEQETPRSRPSTTGTFPVPPEIEDNVAFWRKVYGEWSRDKVAIHDDEYLGVIYEVMELPGPTSAGYTDEQNRYVRARTAHYQSLLEALESDIRAGRSPLGYEKALYDKLVDAGGMHALYGASERVRAQRGLRERFRRGLEISGRYDAKFREIFRSRGLPEDLAYLPHVESSFQAHARSSVGAAGMWQFTLGTGKSYMTINNAVDERLDPVIAAEGAARYLGEAYGKLRSWPLAVTSYNHGQGGMRQAKAIYGDDIGTIVRKYKGPYFKFASRNFYAEFIAARQVASNPEKFFPEGIRYQAPLSEERLVLHHGMPATHVARHYGIATYRLADLNRHWRKSAQEGGAYLPAGTTVWLPEGSLDRVAGAPAPLPVVVAKVESEPEPIQLAEAKPVVKPSKVAKAEVRSKAEKGSKAQPKVAKTEAVSKPQKVAAVAPKQKRVASREMGQTAKVHVVKPNETLYRVATYYELSVEQLRRFNRMGPNDNNIRPGQRLRVSS